MGLPGCPAVATMLGYPETGPLPPYALFLYARILCITGIPSGGSVLIVNLAEVHYKVIVAELHASLRGSTRWQHG